MTIKTGIRCIAALLIMFLFPSYAPADSLSAYEIMKMTNDRDDGDNATSDMEMVLINRNGKKRVRKMKRFIKDFGKDVHSVIFFRAPANVEGTGFLSYDYDDTGKDDDQWLYLPALKKVKRIASSDKDSSFMGSDYTYGDMTKFALDSYHLKHIKEVAVRDHMTWLIEARPKTKAVIDTYGYKKILFFVRQDNFMIVRAVKWMKEGARIRFMDTPIIEKIDGIWTPVQMTVTTQKGKSVEHKTILNYSRIKFNQPISKNTFTTHQLKKGI